MKLTISFEIAELISVIQEVEIFEDYTKEEVIYFFNSGRFLTGISTDSTILDINTITDVGKVISTSFSHDLSYTSFKEVA